MLVIIWTKNYAFINTKATTYGCGRAKEKYEAVSPQASFYAFPTHASSNSFELCFRQTIFVMFQVEFNEGCFPEINFA
ncbi:CLUMA_CG007337, isoform A [Clunio marinus]|uniref:CLUMA_CG007337, isoform A n=1 Tax=Clunio marinus TaxID=568069 RepID=A0A1J1I220_9DIPT|nr:CLUMA_CG007337, isoform A [Clunio marinus]